MYYTAAEFVLTETFKRFWKNWTTILSLRQLASVAIPVAAKPLAAIHRDFVDQSSIHPQYKKIIVNLDGSEATWDEGTKNIMRAAMTAGVITSAKAAIDAASLVFAHSVLDDSAWSYLRVCALACPADWEAIIAEKKINVASLRGRDFKAVRDQKIKERLEEIERESLLKGVSTLLCKRSGLVFGFGDGCAREGAAPLPSLSDVEGFCGVMMPPFPEPASAGATEW